MRTIRGTYRNEIIEPSEAVEGREGQSVLITFLNGDSDLPCLEGPVDEADTLGPLIEAYSVDTGIADLAHEHDHYLYGKPRKGW